MTPAPATARRHPESASEGDTSVPALRDTAVVTDAEVRRAGTSYEQFRRSLGSDVARGYLGLAMSGSTARWMLASDEACRALYAHWIAAGGPDSDQGRAQFSAGELGAPGYARQDQPRADPASAVTGVATGRGTARARGGGARLLPTAAAPPRDAPLAVASFVAGVVSVLAWEFGLVPLVAIVCGALFLWKQRGVPAPGVRWLAWVGVASGSVFLLAAVVLILQRAAGLRG